MVCDPWPLDMSCCPDWDTLPDPIKEHSSRLATEHIWMLSGRQFGMCTITVRPCRQKCRRNTAFYGYGPGWTPVLDGGKWINIACGQCAADDCSCTRLCSVILDPNVGPVQSIQKVVVDGVPLAADATVVVSANTPMVTQIRAGEDADTRTVVLLPPLGLPKPAPRTFTITGPDSFSQTIDVAAGERGEITPGVDGAYVITDTATSQAATVTVPHAGGGALLGTVRSGWWLRLENPATSPGWIHYNLHGLDPDSDLDESGSLAPGASTQTRQGETYDITLTLAPGTSEEAVLQIAPGSAPQTVLINGAYQLLDRNELVRTDGECWPDCQDLTVGDDEPGAFSVTYSYGLPVPLSALHAAETLACEFGRSCVGSDDCNLPQRVQQIVRDGITMTLLDPADYLNDGLTGLPTVDAFLKAINPYQLASRSQVLSPDMPKQRRVVWP